MKRILRMENHFSVSRIIDRITGPTKQVRESLHAISAPIKQMRIKKAHKISR